MHAVKPRFTKVSELDRTNRFSNRNFELEMPLFSNKISILEHRRPNIFNAALNSRALHVLFCLIVLHLAFVFDTLSIRAQCKIPC